VSYTGVIPVNSTTSVYYTNDIYAPDYITPLISIPTGDLSKEQLEKFIKHKVYPAFLIEHGRLCRLEMWGTGKQPEVRPLKRNTERAVLQRLARTPWIPLMISTFAQQLLVDGFKKEGSKDNAPGWQTWLRNKMPAQQLSINRATMIFGYSYVRVLEGDTKDAKGKSIASVRGVDPRDCFALYEDNYADEYPKYVLERKPGTAIGKWYWWLPNGDYYELDETRGEFKVTGEFTTSYGAPPFVRYLNQIDLRGRTWGDVEPVIDLAARIDKTAFDRLLVQHFNSFKVRWATGLEQADSQEGIEQDKIRIANEDILVASDIGAKFGTLSETSMDGFIAAYQNDLEAFAAVMQLPPNLMGNVINVAADALDAARRQTYQRLFEKQTVLGESHAQMMRLCALIEGRDADAEDFTARVHWQDVEVRSLAQFADAWGKIVMQLGIPKWAAWDKIPGVDQTEVEGWKKHALDNDPLSVYLRDVVGRDANTFGVNPADAAMFSKADSSGQVGQPPGSPGGPAPTGGTNKGGGSNGSTNQPRMNNKTGLSKGTPAK
jgi:hypothetical protein